MKHRNISRIVALAGLLVFSIATQADNKSEEQARQSSPKPSTTLSAAASAASAAAEAAVAAANAATAASNASAAAVEAINAILPPSQRIVSSPSQPTETADKLPNTDIAENTNTKPPQDHKVDTAQVLTQETTTTQNREPTHRFTTPTEHSLVGLVGMFEVSVAADARGDFSAGVLSQNVEPVETVTQISLAEAITESLGFSRDVHIASSRVEQAKAQTGQAKAFLLPSLLLNVKAGRERSSPGVEIDDNTGETESVSNHSRSDTSLTLKQPLLDLPSFYDWKRRKVLETSRQENVRSSQGDVYLDTVSAYLALTSARLQVEMARDYEAQLQTLFDYIDKRSAAGLASHSDKERVRARSLSAHAARIEQEAQQAAAGIEFVRLVNLAPTSMRIPDLEELGISIVPQDVRQAMPLAISSNPDIAELNKELQAARIDQKSAKAKYYPRFDLELSTNRTAHAGGSDDIQDDQRMMLAMNWSLFNGGSDKKLREEKSARIVELNYKLDDQRRRVLQSITAQYATLEGVRQRIEAGYQELASISSAADAMSNRMVSGKQSLLDMLDVYSRYFNIRTQLVELHTQEMNAVAQIVRLIQGAPSLDATRHSHT